MSDEVKIKAMKRIIFHQMRHGQWTSRRDYRPSVSDDTFTIFECQVAKVCILNHKRFEISIDGNRFPLSALGIDNLYFLYLFYFFVLPKSISSKWKRYRRDISDKKDKERNKLLSVSDAFFQANKELDRDIKLDDIIK